MGQYAQESSKRVTSEVEKQRQSDVRNSDQRQAKLVTQITPLRAELAKLVGEHREIELNLRSKKFRMETEVENWLTKYDDFMGGQQDNIEKVQSDDLRERFAVLKVDYEEIMAERERIRLEEEARKKEFEERTYNATVIQAFFRSYKVRKNMKNKGKKGKGKKGKK